MDSDRLPAEAPAPPLPRPPVLPAAPAGCVVVDIASAASSHGWGWAARTTPDNDEFVRKHQRSRGSGVVQTMASEIGDWLRTLESDRPITVRCFASILRTALLPHLDPARYALVDGLALGPGTAWAEAAKTDLVKQLSDQEETLRQHRVLYAASDGALHPFYGNGAYSWVTQFGQYEIGRAPRNILLAELTGIIQFAKSIPFNTFGKGVLFVDSLRAIGAIHNHAAVLWRLADQEGMLQTVSMVRGKRLELVWVRGHNGHVLNDVADRLALMRHRAIRMGLDQKTITASADRIVSMEKDKLLGTNWASAHERARRDWQQLTLANGGDWSARPKASAA